MSVTTSQQIARLYEQYSTIDVTFTRDVIKNTLLYPKQIFIKCIGYQWPCILYSSSMSGAKVIINVQNSFKQIVGKANNNVSLRYSFIQREKSDPISFFVNARIVDYVPYGNENPDLNFIQLSFSGQPPDDLIGKLGTLLDAHSIAQNRKEERIALTTDAIKALRLNVRGAMVLIDHIQRKCIVRDISFSAARLIIMGVPKFLVNKPIALKLKFEDPDETIDLIGKVIRFEAIEGRQDVGAFVVQFHEGNVPVEYKMRLSLYLKSQGKRPLVSSVTNTNTNSKNTDNKE